MRGTLDKLVVKECDYSDKTIVGELQISSRGVEGKTKVVIVNEAVKQLEEQNIAKGKLEPTTIEFTDVIVRYIVSEGHKVSLMVNKFGSAKH